LAIYSIVIVVPEKHVLTLMMANNIKCV
jgi:hypothetical protein